MNLDQMQRDNYKCASEYDISMGYGSQENIERLTSVISKMKKRVEDRNILELASDPGFWTSQINQTDKFIVAVDYNQLTLAQGALKNLPTDTVYFQQIDAYASDTAKGDFDILIAVD